MSQEKNIPEKHIEIMIDQEGQLYGVLLSPAIWKKVAAMVTKEAQKLQQFHIQAPITENPSPPTTLIEVEEQKHKGESILIRKKIKTDPQPFKNTVASFSKFLEQGGE
jgi:hypothetical protein